MRPIDADEITSWMIQELRQQPNGVFNGLNGRQAANLIGKAIDEAPTIGGWISVKDDLPKEHDSIFANNAHLSKYMWAKESDDVIVYVKFPDGTGRSTEGRLRDGKWSTKISQVLEPVVTHWMPMPEAPKGVNTDEAD